MSSSLSPFTFDFLPSPFLILILATACTRLLATMKSSIVLFILALIVATVQAASLDTNAARLARGLPPRAPRKLYRNLPTAVERTSRVFLSCIIHAWCCAPPCMSNTLLDAYTRRIVFDTRFWSIIRVRARTGVPQSPSAMCL